MMQSQKEAVARAGRALGTLERATALSRQARSPSEYHTCLVTMFPFAEGYDWYNEGDIYREVFDQAFREVFLRP